VNVTATPATIGDGGGLTVTTAGGLTREASAPSRADAEPGVEIATASAAKASKPSVLERDESDPACASERIDIAHTVLSEGLNAN
jgi:hypothetical protein